MNHVICSVTFQSPHDRDEIPQVREVGVSRCNSFWTKQYGIHVLVVSPLRGRDTSNAKSTPREPFPFIVGSRVTAPWWPKGGVDAHNRIPGKT